MYHQPTSVAVVAWTGGSEPADIHSVSGLESNLAHRLYDMQLAAFAAFWGKGADQGTRELYWRRARFDAHATVRAGVQLQENLR